MSARFSARARALDGVLSRVRLRAQLAGGVSPGLSIPWLPGPLLTNIVLLICVTPPPKILSNCPLVSFRWRRRYRGGACEALPSWSIGPSYLRISPASEARKRLA